MSLKVVQKASALSNCHQCSLVNAFAMPLLTVHPHLPHLSSSARGNLGILPAVERKLNLNIHAEIRALPPFGFEQFSVTPP
jgi:hypothetical protein